MIKKTLRKILPVSIKNQIGMILEMAIKKRIIKRNYSGFPLFVHLEDRTGYEWYNNDWDLLPEIELLKKGKLCSGAKVFDCGAHQGILASILANITSEKGQVIAVEANPHNFDLAVKNRDINALSQLEIINKAVGEKEGEVSFINRSNGRIKLKNINEKGIKIPCTTVDQLSKEFGTPDVIFIDVEGYEVNVLKGAKRTLESRPDCFIEVHVGCGLENFGYTAQDVLDFLHKYKYQIFVKPQKEKEFKLLEKNSECPKEHFYLVALSV